MPTDKPNILLITTDQQRFDAAGGAGPSFLRTPHYDQLCNEGIAFTSAYSDCPLCVPARISIMTGKTVAAHGTPGNSETAKVMDREGTLPTLLRAQGYQTAAIGKMHFGPERARHGFDEMLIPSDYYNWMKRSGHPVQPMQHGLGQNELYPGMATVPEGLTLTSWIAEQCKEYILERRDPTVPFFLWCSFSKPHPPIDPPEPYYSMYRDCPIPEPVVADWATGERCPEPFRRMRERQSFDRIPPEVIREARAAYYGVITQIDYNIGRILSALQDLDMLTETLILYTSDHGEFLGDHNSGSKIFFHEGSAHIPYVLRLPKSWENRMPGSRCDALATHADVLPTLLAAAGASAPSHCDGLNLTAVARGETSRRDYLEAMSTPTGQRAYAAITDGRWKYMWYPEGATEQLFDIETDPMEERDLAGVGEYADKQAELKAELVRRHAERRSEFVKDGELQSFPRLGDTEAERRNGAWPGYHTEHYWADVRH